MIEIQNLRVCFGESVAVDGLSFSIPAGSMYGLLGPNGAGKTTTLNCLAGLLTPTAGRITIDGEPVSRASGLAQTRIGLVPQSLALYDTLTVRQNLAIFGGLYNLGARQLRCRIEWGLALARLEEREKSRVETLSGGMKRRLNLACSLLHDPEVVICDEPTTGVDPQSRNHLFESLRELNRAGKTVIYTTHYMEEVQALCSRVAIMDRGQLVADDELKVLLHVDGEQRRFRLELEAGADPAELHRVIAQSGLAFGSLEPVQRTLEDLFLELTGRGLRDN